MLTFTNHFPKLLLKKQPVRVATWLVCLVVLALGGCSGRGKLQIKDARPVSHAGWNSLLQKHVTKAGLVNYAGFQQDSLQLRSYLQTLAKNPPNKKYWSDDERKAYWINAYNAFTIDIVMRNYPVKSIRDIGPKVTLPFVNTVWDIKFINIGGEILDLNNIEHKKLRKQFGDPRIHFAVVCASASCPVLRNEAFVAERLEAQLDDQGKLFLADNFRNQLSPDSLKLSKIFSWYKGDFTKTTDLVTYLQQFTTVKISDDPKIEFLEYDWSLNKQ